MKRFILCHGAQTEYDDEGKPVGYTPRDDIIVNVEQIGAAYDHTLIIMGHKIRVMETMDTIKEKLGVR